MTNSDQLPPIGTVVAGKYRIERELGRGGMGAVYLATHVVTGREVALKWVLRRATEGDRSHERLIQEAKAAGRIRHPNVVDVYDVGFHEGAFYLVMEALEGRSLRAALRTLGRVAVPDAIRLLVQLMRGVAAAHDAGVIHRDLKPDNIFLCQTPAGEPLPPKILDFGISRLTPASEAGPESHLTETGVFVGTPAYLPPEVLTSGERADHRADVYALGVILYELLTGQLPFSAPNYPALIIQVATKAPTPPRRLVPGLPEELEALILQALSKHPDDRFSTVEAFAVALEPFGDGVRFSAAASGGNGLGLAQSEPPPALSTAATEESVSAVPSSPTWAEAPTVEDVSVHGRRRTSEVSTMDSELETPPISGLDAPKGRHALLVVAVLTTVGLVVAYLAVGGQTPRDAEGPSESASSPEDPASEARAASIEAEEPPPPTLVEQGGDAPSSATEPPEPGAPAGPVAAPLGDDPSASGSTPGRRAARPRTARASGTPMEAAPTTSPEPARSTTMEPAPRLGTLTVDEF